MWYNSKSIRSHKSRKSKCSRGTVDFFSRAPYGKFYITTADKFVVPFPSGNKTCKVIDVVTYRGDKPISFEVVVRPQ